MASKHLKAFRKTWADSCKSMWIEIAAVRALEGYLKGSYSEIDPAAVLTDLFHAPECSGRIDDSTKDFVLTNTARWISSITLSRLVILSACFECYFEGFLTSYLDNRERYFSGGRRTKEGNRVWGEVLKTRGLAERVESFSRETDAKIRSITTKLGALRDVYIARNIVAHDAGICSESDAPRLSILRGAPEQRIEVSAEVLVSDLADPCIRIADSLDSKIKPR